MSRRAARVSREKIAALLGREAPIEHFITEAHRVLRVSSAVTAARVGVIRETLGAAWLDALLQPPPPAPHRPLLATDDRHELVRWICMPSRDGLARALGLGGDLMLIRGCAGFEKLLPLLRDAEQFDRARIHVALTARLISAGATDIELEPPTADGRAADIALTFARARFVVELFRPEWPRPPHLDLWEISLAKMLGEVVGDVLIIATLLDVEPWSAAERVEFQNGMTRAAQRAFASAIGDGRAEVYERAIVEAFTLSTLDATDREALLSQTAADRRPICGAHVFTAASNQLRRLVRGEPVSRCLQRAAFICTPTPTSEQRAAERDRAVQRVLRQAGRKAAQLRTGDERVEGIVAIEPGSLGGNDEGVRDLLERVGGPLTDRHAHVSAVLLLEQSAVVPLLEYSGTGTSVASRALLMALRDLEHTTIPRTFG
jgi:hypothetical protein